MPVSDLHRQVATVALAAAARHGFALGGGNALIAHGLISRVTHDVDLFTDQEDGVQAAAGSVQSALRAAGFVTERQDKTGGLSYVFEGMGDGLAEWIITAPGGAQMALQMAYFDRGRAPVIMDFGPVLDLEDAVGSKVCALVPLTELRARSWQILGRRSLSVASFPAREACGGREGSGGADCAARWENARDRGSVGALPAARYRGRGRRLGNRFLERFAGGWSADCDAVLIRE